MFPDSPKGSKRPTLADNHFSWAQGSELSNDQLSFDSQQPVKLNRVSTYRTSFVNEFSDLDQLSTYLLMSCKSNLLSQNEEFPAQLGESVVHRRQAETCCLIADPGKHIQAKIEEIFSMHCLYGCRHLM